MRSHFFFLFTLFGTALQVIPPALVLPGLALVGMIQPGIAQAEPEEVAARPTRLIPPTAHSMAADPASLCESAISTAELVGRLPLRMLAAISLTESGRMDPAIGIPRPWPWTINAAGEGQFFATKKAAIAAVTALQAHGVQSIDVGCMQVNLMYHPHAFASLAEAFEPRSNALYATHFLNALYAESRSWPSAIAAYHSQTPALGDAYRILVVSRWQNGGMQNPASRYLHPGGAAYRDFAPTGQVYGAFIARTHIYSAFETSPVKR